MISGRKEQAKGPKPYSWCLTKQWFPFARHFADEFTWTAVREADGGAIPTIQSIASNIQMPSFPEILVQLSYARDNTSLHETNTLLVKIVHDATRRTKKLCYKNSRYGNEFRNHDRSSKISFVQRTLTIIYSKKDISLYTVANPWCFF